MSNLFCEIKRYFELFFGFVQKMLNLIVMRYKAKLKIYSKNSKLQINVT